MLTVLQNMPPRPSFECVSSGGGGLQGSSLTRRGLCGRLQGKSKVFVSTSVTIDSTPLARIKGVYRERYSLTQKYAKKSFNNNDNKVLGDRLRTQCELGRCLDSTPADIAGDHAVNIKAVGIHWIFLPEPTGIDLTRFDPIRPDPTTSDRTKPTPTDIDV